MKRILGIGLFIFFALVITNTAVADPFFDILVDVDISDTYDYRYTVSYPPCCYNPSDLRAISHWWLEINCAHSTIDPGSIFGYSIFNDVSYDWIMTFDHNVGQVGAYTDWVIKWDVPAGLELPKDHGTIIGYFGFHSSQAPVDGYWGGKGSALFDRGLTQKPACIPEPASLSLLSLGFLGFGFLKGKKRL